MSEKHPPFKRNDLLNIALFLNTFLGKETLQDIPYPENLQKPFRELPLDQKGEYISFTHQYVIRETEYAISGLLGRELKPSEHGLIRRRVVTFVSENVWKKYKDN
jgi:hypothetical protein